MNEIELDSISFSIASKEDIIRKSVYEVAISKYSDTKSNTVYDHLSGAIFNKRCQTCKQQEQKCPGHFGVLYLNAPIVHPIFFSHIFFMLKIFCYNCSNLLISKHHLEYSGILKYEGERRLNEIALKIKKVDRCFFCKTLKRDYKIKKELFYNTIVYAGDVEISDHEILKIFEDISDSTIQLLGCSHPKNCILEVFPIIPPCCRPYDFSGTSIKEDDLTKQLIEVIKANNNIVSSVDKKTAIHNLKFKIEAYCRNPKKSPKNLNNEPIKGIRERLTGKDGQLRTNLMGKRTEMSSRTVIGPGPNLKVDEVGIPEKIASIITFPMTVTQENIDCIKQMAISGIVKKITRDDEILRIDVQIFSEVLKFVKKNDRIVRSDGTNFIVNDPKVVLYEDDLIFRKGLDVTPPEIPKLNEPDIVVGDIAHRRIKNGDWVLMNRQPTLWKGSMMAFKTVIVPHKTFTFNLAVCKAFNSDFDGDEQNAHFPQSIESQVELQCLSTPKSCILSSSNGTPVLVILQDALLGAYLMTKTKMQTPKSVVFDIIMKLSKNTNYYLRRMKNIEKTLKSLGLFSNDKCIYQSQNVISLIFPETFTKKFDDLTIINGVICSGFLTKKYLGSSKNSLIFYLKSEYSDDVCIDFINDIQFLTNKWLTFHSFSINVCDFFQNNIDVDVEMCLNEAESVQRTFHNKQLKESKTQHILSNAKDLGIKFSAADSLNNMTTTIRAGSKGDFFNLGQVKGMLGQQLINGKRIEKLLDNRRRTLVHYKRDETMLSVREKYESRGFVCSSFYKGLNPREFFFHAKSGRQGVCDTAMTTHSAGYSMRKLIKLLEDVVVQNNHTVSDSNGVVYSYAFGETGFNPENRTESLDGIFAQLDDC